MNQAEISSPGKHCDVFTHPVREGDEGDLRDHLELGDPTQNDRAGTAMTEPSVQYEVTPGRRAFINSQARTRSQVQRWPGRQNFNLRVEADATIVIRSNPANPFHRPRRSSIWLTLK